MAITILMPALSPSMEEAALTKWLVAVGDTVAVGDVIAEVETDKTVTEIEAIHSGEIEALLVAAGAQGVKVNAPIAMLRAAPDNARVAKARAMAPEPPRIAASPLARRVAAERGLDLASLTGSGPGGRIVRADLDRDPASAGDLAAPRESFTGNRAFQAPPPDDENAAPTVRLVGAEGATLRYSLRRDATLDPLVALRAEFNGLAADQGVRLTITDFIVRACALALQQIPACNAAWVGERVVRFSAADVVVAIAVGDGHDTAVVRGAEALSMTALSAELKDLAAKARDGTLARQTQQGGALAVTNLGMFGVESFEVGLSTSFAAILAVGAAARRPVARGDGVVIATLLPLTLTLDQRVIDGVLGARLLQAITKNLEAPLTLLL